MGEKRYINHIVNKLQCSRAKKAEIRKELESDIHSALEQGEALDKILERIGAPDNVAMEFNNSFSNKERKAAKWRKRLFILLPVIAVLVILILLLIWWFPKVKELGTSGIYQEQTVTEHTMEIIDLWNADDMEGICQASNDKMNAVVTSDNLANIKASFSRDWGECKGFGQPYIMEITQMGETMVTIQINASYENISVTYTISFDKDMKLAGFYVK